MSALAEGSNAAGAIPEPLCASSIPICVHNLRANVQWVVGTAAADAVALAYCRLYAAVSDVRCVE